ncbi:hypothetical protein JZ751_027018 [Albula glossodonta]|uniref:Dendritic cell-specific transmembrane protein-like domain-containing protein n=1 Tax=Albula glossodonta TaxID=121402 RepID=A0A8T2NFT3_9TELE|nr:hypothetical protein JZ751_027018 [Albula glossodonta]
MQGGKKESLMSPSVNESKMELNIIRDVYCKPRPRNSKELAGLFFLCFSIVVSTGGLLYCWMAFTLKYDPSLSIIVAVVWVAILAPALVLVHPFRCAFTIIIPSLGTKQGRKILLSVALTMLVASCIPSMVNNIKVVGEMIKCSTVVTAEEIVRSQTMVKSALSDMRETLKSVPQLLDISSQLHLQNSADIKELKRKLKEASDELVEDIDSKQNIVESTTDDTKKVIAMVFILALFGGSARYVIGYLTDPRYDNLYLTHRLMELLKAKGVYVDGPYGDVVAFFKGERDKTITMQRTYPFTIPILPSQCVPTLQPPDSSLLVKVGALYLTAFIMLLGEVYARRIRRKICASFYRDREEERIQYLLVKVLEKRENDRRSKR